MAYTPEVNQVFSGALRRLAWALDQPMTRTLNDVIFHAASVVDRERVCSNCRDDSVCEICLFGKEEGECYVDQERRVGPSGVSEMLRQMPVS